MAKYHDLAAKYAEEIQWIKTSKEQYERLARQADEINPVLHPEPDFVAIAEADDLAQRAQQAYDGLMCEWEKLSQDIEAEYWDVPFAKSRDAGIEGFWREVGLSPR